MFFYILRKRPAEDTAKKISEPEGTFDINFTKANTNFFTRLDYNDDDCHLNAKC